jgi:glutathione S-transferase
LLEELGVPYEVKRYERDRTTSLAPAELIAVHPLGKSPVITDEGKTVAESGAIVEYLVGKYGRGRLIPAPDSQELLEYRYWLHYAEGSFMPLMVMSLIFNRIENARMPFFIKPIAKGIAGKVRNSYLAPNIGRNLEYLEDTLCKSSWFAGEQFTAADIQMSFPVEAASVRAGLEPDYPKLRAFLERIHERPAYRRALQNGGPYSLLG